MRLWTLHPKHLDPAGLIALWREALLAQAVLLGRTHGYVRHPQLLRFRARPDPPAAIAAYLSAVADEARSRGYLFDPRRIVEASPFTDRIPETTGQLLFEWSHLGRKLRGRNPLWYGRHHRGVKPDAHPVFRLVAGGRRTWERTAATSARRREA